MSETAERAVGPTRTIVYRVGDLTIDLWRGEVRSGDEVSSLGGQPLTILAALLESPNRGLGREELQRRLWPDAPFGDLDQRLNAAVRLLRRALGDSSDEPRYLETLRGRGYRICAAVQPLETAGGDATDLPGRPPTPRRRGVGRFARSRFAPGRVALRGPMVLLGAGLVVLVAALSRGSDPLDQGRLEPGTGVGAAYREYLAATRSFEDQDLDVAILHVEAALDFDPEYTAAHVLLGRLHRARGDAERAEASFLRAIELDPSFTDAHLSLGNLRFWGQWNWREAEESFRVARELTPGRVDVHHSNAWFLLASRRFEDAAASMERALQLDPMSPVLHSDFGWFQYRMRNYPAALQYCHAALDLEPSLRSALDCRHRALARLGSYEEALESALRVSEIPGEVERRLRAASAGGGYRDLLLYLDETGAEPSRFVRAMNLAAAGRVDRALDQLERAVLERDSLLVLIDVTPEFDALVPDARFQGVRRAVRGEVGSPDGSRRPSVPR